LSGAIGCSRKHLISEFRQHIGLSPKPLARILRFNRAVQVIEKSRRVAWAALAHDCGYYDQAHFIRDFHAFAGSTPGEFLRHRLPDSAGSLRD
jgi:AraC-like DNA-binding protein